MCQLSISGVAARDHGAWTCVISDNLSLDTTKQVVSLGVAVGGHLELSQLPGQNTLLCRCSVGDNTQCKEQLCAG